MYRVGQDLKLSIIVPAYNCENTIEKCIDSILQQNMGDMEIIVVNDGSRDKTSDIVVSLSEKNKKIKVINQENSGASAARNCGINVASGQYIMFVDSDDELEHNVLGQLLPIMDQGFDYLVANYKRVISNKNGEIEEFVPQRERKEYRNNNEIWNDLIKLLGEGTINSPWGKIFSREVLLNHEIRMDTKLSIGEDLQFNLDYLEYAERAIILPDVIYIYNTQNSTLTTSYKVNMFEERKMSIERLRYHLKKHNLDTSMVSFLYCKLFFSCVMQEHSIAKKYGDRKKVIRALLQLEEINELKNQYFPSDIQGKILIKVIRSEKILLIDIATYFLLLAKNMMKRNVRRLSV